MISICPKCNHSLTVMEAIQKRCSKCNSGDRPRARKSSVEATACSSSTIKKNFEALVSEELRKKMPRPAA